MEEIYNEIMNSVMFPETETDFSVSNGDVQHSDSNINSDIVEKVGPTNDAYQLEPFPHFEDNDEGWAGTWPSGQDSAVPDDGSSPTYLYLIQGIDTDVLKTDDHLPIHSNYQADFGGQSWSNINIANLDASGQSTTMGIEGQPSAAAMTQNSDFVMQDASAMYSNVNMQATTWPVAGTNDVVLQNRIVPLRNVGGNENAGPLQDMIYSTTLAHQMPDVTFATPQVYSHLPEPQPRKLQKGLMNLLEGTPSQSAFRVQFNRVPPVGVKHSFGPQSAGTSCDMSPGLQQLFESKISEAPVSEFSNYTVGSEYVTHLENIPGDGYSGSNAFEVQNQMQQSPDVDGRQLDTIIYEKDRNYRILGSQQNKGRELPMTATTGSTSTGPENVESQQHFNRLLEERNLLKTSTDLLLKRQAELRAQNAQLVGVARQLDLGAFLERYTELFDVPESMKLGYVDSGTSIDQTQTKTS